VQLPLFVILTIQVAMFCTLVTAIITGAERFEILIIAAFQIAILCSVLVAILTIVVAVVLVAFMNTIRVEDPFIYETQIMISRTGFDDSGLQLEAILSKIYIDRSQGES